MTVLQITCDNCGAKYKLPESFDKPQAKCQKCGSVIDVARQRAATANPTAPSAAKPAAAKPAAAARPAQDRSKPERAAPAAASAAARPARGAKAKEAGEAGGGRRGSRERGEPKEKKGNMLPLLGVAAGVLVVVAVIAVMLKDDAPKQDQAASKDAAKTPAAAAPTPPAGTPAAGTPAAPPANTPPASPAPANGAAKPGDAPAAATTPPASTPAASTPASAAKAPEPADATPKVRDPNKPWENMRNPPQGMDQVSDAKSFSEVTWPDSIDAATKAAVQELAATAKESGGPGMRATNKLKTAEFEFPALFALVEQLRLLDYRNNDDAMLGLALNKVLEEILFDMNTRYAAVTYDEAISPAKAEWNTQTVKAWIGLLGRYPDAETFRRERSARKAKAAEKDREK
jgi:hypothetical protein